MTRLLTLGIFAGAQLSAGYKVAPAGVVAPGAGVVVPAAPLVAMVACGTVTGVVASSQESTLSSSAVGSAATAAGAASACVAVSSPNSGHVGSRSPDLPRVLQRKHSLCFRNDGGYTQSPSA